MGVMMRKNKIIKELLWWVRTVIIAYVLTFTLNHTLIVNASVTSGSMEGTIMTGSRIFGSRLSYAVHAPERFDIIMFKFPDDETADPFLKRVIGLPGEKVEIIDGKVYINDSKTPLDDSFVNGEPRGDYGPFYVPADSYFVLGDNRNNSHDSKNWINKYVARDKILAKIYFEWFPTPKLLDV